MANRNSAVLPLTAEDQAKIDRRNQKQAEKSGISSGRSGGRTLAKALGDDGQEDGALLGGLSQQQHSQISQLQSAWAQANEKGDYAAMNAAHNEAEKIRASAGLTGGADGSLLKEIPRRQRSALDGGYTADDMQKYVDDYNAANSDGSTYYNGYSPDMNERSLANYIRQQMKANSDAWADADEAGKQYLHEQNVALAQILADATGGAQSTYNAELGRWETDNANLGYGYYTGGYNDRQWAKDVYGMTDEQIDAYKNDTDRYYNFVDQHTIRNWIDESSDFTGRYAQFVNGPYPQWLSASATGRPNIQTYADVIGDGVGGGEDGNLYVAPRDANGEIVPQAPYLKGGNVNDYTKSKAAYIEDGVIMPNVLNGTTAKTAHLNMWLNGGTPVEDPSGNHGVTWATAPTEHTRMGGSFRRLSDLGFGTGADSYEDMINKYYDAQLETQAAQLQAQYDQALAELDLQQMQTNSDYESQRRAADGAAARQEAAFREIANAQGLNSGAMGQSALTSGSQAVGNLETIGAAQAAEQADIATQRVLMAQSFQQQIQQAQAENDYARIQALYAEAERVDELLRQQQMQNAQTDQAYMQLFLGA